MARVACTTTKPRLFGMTSLVAITVIIVVSVSFDSSSMASAFVTPTSQSIPATTTSRMLKHRDAHAGVPMIGTCTTTTDAAAAAAASTTTTTSTTTALHARKWNFNEGRSPWGLKKNAEIWNGRLAQMAFVIVLLQELITGKGVVQGLQDGDFANIALVGFAVVSTLALSAFLAIQGEDDLTDLEI